MLEILTDLISQNLILFYCIVLFSSIVSSSLGIGSFILIPFAAIIYGPKASVGIITVYFLVQNINKLIFFKGHANKKIAKIIILWSIPGVLAGSVLLGYLPAYLFEKILGVAIILFLLNDLHTFISKKQSKKSIPLFGLLYGFFSGLLGSGNVIKGPLFLSIGLLKESYIATYALTSFFMNIPKIVIYSWNGVITGDTFVQALPFVFLSFVGTFIGRNVIKRIKSHWFYGIVFIFFIISAMLLIL
ncbi:sulfite exporter TauE/SafE family protein [Patescibacteria group bacterium]|nr:sulfite exporter TauE/SafE family protein [Patescibacteria group bacterium]MBU1015546.1 sulfite exporter TauE/SafE family protein [Patescibacteria group bacterium]MBU1685597.1 sulfite exporter TauE/SafE family protein [Patescibacteria group bacterium]MBU1938985.1 sulfite exporter TauE/SafE family protein [Patescibacteria group bacterium]